MAFFPPIRYRLWHIFALLTVIAVLLAWYGSRMAYIQSETRAIAGEWILIDDSGTPVVDASGSVIRITFNRNDFTVNPYAQPKQIDFRTSIGVSQAIYEWEKGRLRLLQPSVGLQRPNSFSDKITDLECFGPPGVYSLMSCRLERSKK
jgi:hypothetical protein